MENGHATAFPGANGVQRSRSSTAIRITDEHFNIRTPERTALLQQLRDAIQKRRMPVPFWACVQICDLPNLEFLVQLARLSPKTIDIVADLCCGFPYKWVQHPSPFNYVRTETTASDTEPRKSHLKNARYAARERDGHSCVLTGARKVYQVAHIYPSYFSDDDFTDPSMPSIWKFVNIFWGRSTAERWHKAVFNDPDHPEKLVDDCSNLICLRSDLRVAWANGLFALRPIYVSHDAKEMEVELFWQPKQSHKPFGEVDLLIEPGSSKGISSVEELHVVIPAKDNTLLPIQSGHRFTLRTDDPENRPLPDYDLLEMQWYLNRIVALANAAEIFIDDGDDFDDEDDGCTAKPFDQGHKSDVLDWIQNGSAAAPIVYEGDDYPTAIMERKGCNDNGVSHAADFLSNDFHRDFDYLMG